MPRPSSVRSVFLALLLLACALVAFGCLSKGADESAGDREAKEAAAEPEWEADESGGSEPGSYAMEGETYEEAPARARDDAPSSAPVSLADDSNLDRVENSATTQKPEPAKDKPRERRRLIVYEAWLRLGVDSIDAALRRAEEITATYGGYIESSTLESRVLRIPSASYASALAALRELGEVRSIRQQSQDVTEAYTDLVARIDNLRALETRFETLLAEATTVADRLKIERELRRVRQELRVLEARRKVLANKAAFATISFSVEARSDERVTRDRVQPFQFARGYGLQEVL